MCKVNVLAATAAFEEEQMLQKKIKEMAHPYYGLSDSQSLTRYPKRMCKISRNWMSQFIEAEGKCDAMEVWGISPENEKWEQYQPEFIAQILQVLGRVDDVNLEMAQRIFSKYSPRDEEEYYRVVKGFNRLDILGMYRIKYTGSILTLGWMSLAKFTKYIVNHAQDPFMIRDMVAGIDYHDLALEFKNDLETTGSGQLGVFHSNFYETYFIPLSFGKWGKYVKGCVNKWEKRKELPSPQCCDNIVEYKMSRRSIFYYIANSRKNPFIHLKELGMKPFEETVYFGNTHFYDMGNGNLLKYDPVKDKYTNYFARKGGKYYVFHYRDQYHVWAKDAKNHVSANTLKEALYLLERVVRRNRLELSLNDVRNDKPYTSGFCLAGTKEFARQRTPFIYHLIKNYDKWSDIPKDILETTWAIRDKSVFNGFPMP